MAAAEKDRDGYANRYLLDLQGLNVLDLSQKGFTTLHWITLLLQNRVFTLKNDIIKAGKRYLVEHFSLPVHTYDVIKGYRADDSYFAYLIAKYLKPICPLKSIRQKRKLSQTQLSSLSNVPLRTIKAYEQGTVDIAKAQAETLYSLAQTLHCTIEELIR